MYGSPSLFAMSTPAVENIEMYSASGLYALIVLDVVTNEIS